MIIQKVEFHTGGLKSIFLQIITNWREGQKKLIKRGETNEQVGTKNKILIWYGWTHRQTDTKSYI